MDNSKKALFLLLVVCALWLKSAQAAVFMDGGTCVPNTLFGNNCLFSNFYANQPGGLSLLPVESNGGTRISGTLSDDRFRFTTGSVAFLDGSADLATGEIKIQANSVLGTTDLFAALRATISDSVHLTGSTAADGLDDGLYSVTVGWTVDGNRTTDFTNPASIIFNSLISLSLNMPVSGEICSDDILMPNLSAGDAENFSETVELNCAVPADFRFFASLASGRVNDGFFDAGSTAQLYINLPPGVTFTSGSGVLLSQVDSVPGIPEPGTSTLIGIALAAATALRRRRPAA